MATPLCYQIHAGSNTAASATNLTIGIGAVQTLAIGPNVIIRVCPTTAVNIRFGTSAIAVATAADVLVPAGSVEFFDMGSNTGIAVFAVAASVVNISICSRT